MTATTTFDFLHDRLIAMSDPEKDQRALTEILAHLKSIASIIAQEVAESDNDDTSKWAAEAQPEIDDMIQDVQDVLDDILEDIKDGGSDEDTEDS